MCISYLPPRPLPSPTSLRTIPPNLPASTVRARPPSDKFQPVARRRGGLSSQLWPDCRHSGQNPISPWYIPATVWWSRTGRAEYSPLWRPLAPLATDCPPLAQYPPLPDLEHQLLAWLEPLHCVQPQSYNSHEINEHLDLSTRTGLLILEQEVEVEEGKLTRSGQTLE